jgi:hypothetical protein
MKHRVTLSEAISANRYIDTIRSATYKSVNDAFFLMTKLRGIVSSASHTRFIELVKGQFSDYFEQAMKINMTKALNEALGAGVSTHFVFRKTPKNTAGFARGTSIVLSDRLSKKITEPIMEYVFEITYNNYGGEDFVAGFYDVCSEFYELRRSVEDIVNPTLPSFTRTVIHELIHVLQHAKQRDQYDTEYRSYLDKKPGEFVKTARSRDEKSLANEPIDPNLEKKYIKLYYASPQEMAAIAHEAAHAAIQYYGFDNATTPNELQIKNIRASDIIHYIDWFTEGLIKDPKTRREAMVRNRYIKLVYQEIVQYLNYRLEQLKY